MEKGGFLEREKIEPIGEGRPHHSLTLESATVQDAGWERNWGPSQ